MRVVILGKGGHAKVLADTVYDRGYDCVQFDEEQEKDILPTDYLIVGIGIGIDIGIPLDRMTLFHRYNPARFITITSPSAYVSPKARLGRGVDVGVHAMVGPGANIGDNVLVNHGAQVAHDCIIRDHCIISAGAILCGNVTLGRACAIGAGAIIVQRVELPDETRVPAGTLVVGHGDFRKPVRVVYDREAKTALDKIAGFPGIMQV